MWNLNTQIDTIHCSQTISCFFFFQILETERCQPVDGSIISQVQAWQMDKSQQCVTFYGSLPSHISLSVISLPFSSGKHYSTDLTSPEATTDAGKIKSRNNMPLKAC